MGKKIIAAIVALFAVHLFGQTSNLQEDGKQWIDKIARAYGDLSSYQFEGTILSEITGYQNASKSSTFARYAKPKENKLRYQAGMGDSKCVVACDGVSTIVYYAGSRQYLKKPSADVNAVINDIFKSEASAYLGAAFPGSYSKLGSQCRSIKAVRREAINFRSTRIDCIVVEAELIPEDAFPPMHTVRTLWIDPGKLVVLRDATHSQILSMKGKVFYDSTEEVRLSSYRINEDVADSSLQFEPPRTAYLTAALNLPDSDSVLFIGPPLERNQFLDLNGKQYSFKELRGQVVLLDFWATWCAPCLKEMAVLEKFHLRYKDKGLVILGVNQEQESLQINLLKKKKFSFPMLFDRGGSLTRQFKALELPTMVVIDRQGKVVAWEQGLQKQEDLEDLLGLLGIQ